MTMKNNTKYAGAILLLVFAIACSPSEDKIGLGSVLSKSQLKYTVTQNPDYKNQFFLKSETEGVISYWDYELGHTNKTIDTVVLPFEGTYYIKYSAFAAGGRTIDSVEVTVPENDQTFFSDPKWEQLTGNSQGKYWELYRVTLGPASDYTAVWGEPSWWPAGAANFNDSCYFDLDKGFHYKRYHNGIVTPSAFVLDTDEVLTGTVLTDPGAAIGIPSTNQMAVADGSNEMAKDNKTRYRVYFLNNDTLVVGQGAYYTSDRPSQDWGYYHWYVKK